MCFDIVREMAMAKSDKRFSGQQKYILKAAATYSIWTREEQHHAGYAVPDLLCPLCQQAPDSIFHRCWSCQHPSVKAAREKVAEPWLIRWALECGQSEPVWTTGVFLHPAADTDSWPLPSFDPAIRITDGLGHPLSAADIPSDAKIICPDGSAVRHPIAELSRAAWAFAGMRAGEDQPAFVVQGPVWAGLPQTSQAAEQVAAAMIPKFVTWNWSGYPDCQAVVSVCSKDTVRQLHSKAMYAGVRRYALQQPGAETMVAMEHVPAHRSLEVIRELDHQKRSVGMGNYHADLSAKHALGLHPKPTPDIEKDIELLVGRARVIMRVIANVLVLYPVERFERAPRKSNTDGMQAAPSSALPAVHNDAHNLQLIYGRWHCTKCTLSQGGQVGSPPPANCCRAWQLPSGLRQVIANPQGSHARSADS